MEKNLDLLEAISVRPSIVFIIGKSKYVVPMSNIEHIRMYDEKIEVKTKTERYNNLEEKNFIII